jgi:hypothetical protein
VMTAASAAINLMITVLVGSTARFIRTPNLRVGGPDCHRCRGSRIEWRSLPMVRRGR